MEQNIDTRHRTTCLQMPIMKRQKWINCVMPSNGHAPEISHDEPEFMKMNIMFKKAKIMKSYILGK